MSGPQFSNPLVGLSQAGAQARIAAMEANDLLASAMVLHGVLIEQPDADEAVVDGLGYLALHGGLQQPFEVEQARAILSHTLAQPFDEATWDRISSANAGFEAVALRYAESSAAALRLVSARLAVRLHDEAAIAKGIRLAQGLLGDFNPDPQALVAHLATMHPDDSALVWEKLLQYLTDHTQNGKLVRRLQVVFVLSATFLEDREYRLLVERIRAIDQADTRSPIFKGDGLVGIVDRMDQVRHGETVSFSTDEGTAFLALTSELPASSGVPFHLIGSTRFPLLLDPSHLMDQIEAGAAAMSGVARPLSSDGVVVFGMEDASSFSDERSLAMRRWDAITGMNRDQPHRPAVEDGGDPIATWYNTSGSEDRRYWALTFTHPTMGMSRPPSPAKTGNSAPDWLDEQGARQGQVEGRPPTSGLYE